MKQRIKRGRDPSWFVIDLRNFTNLGGDAITGVTYDSGNLLAGNFTSVTWNGTDAVFTGTPSGGTTR